MGISNEEIIDLLKHEISELRQDKLSYLEEIDQLKIELKDEREEKERHKNSNKEGWEIAESLSKQVSGLHEHIESALREFDSGDRLEGLHILKSALDGDQEEDPHETHMAANRELYYGD